MLKKSTSFLILVTLVALVLRLIGIQYGFPFIYHPDEPTIVRSALGIRFDPNPGHFDWPHLYIYVNYFVYMIFARVRDFGLISWLTNFVPALLDESLAYYLLTRVLSALLGALTAIPVYLASAKLFGKKAGLISAVLLALMPMHVANSHYALPDVPMLFFMSWGVYFSACIFTSPKLKNYLLGGLFIGLAASTKYNGALASLGLFAAHITRLITKKLSMFHSLDYLIISGTFAVLGFLAGTPFALLDYDTFIRTDGPKGALWQFTNVGSLAFPEHVINFFQDITGKLFADTGYVAMAAYLIFFCVLIYKFFANRASEKDFVAAAFYIVSLGFIYYVSGFQHSRSHYYFIAYPYIAILAGVALNALIMWLAQKSRVSLMASLILGIVLLLPLLLSLNTTLVYAKEDTRNQAYNYLAAHVPYSSFIVYVNDDLMGVVKAVPVASAKGIDKITRAPAGYLVVSFEGGYLKEKMQLRDVVNLVELREVARFDDINRRGPTVVIFKYSL